MTAPHILGLDDPYYPSALRNLRRRPPIMYPQGRLDLLERPSIAVIGTRRQPEVGNLAISFTHLHPLAPRFLALLETYKR
ncbi:MAG: DNA-processing protein DprA [Gemmatimonadota bacterium]|nr:MAG: DNA-processing protein DprA [Gemmatimonadota bacterium]